MRKVGGRRAWVRLSAAYEAQRDDSGLLPATFEVLYGQAWAPSATRRRRSADEEIEVSLAAIGRRP